MANTTFSHMGFQSRFHAFEEHLGYTFISPEIQTLLRHPGTLSPNRRKKSSRDWAETAELSSFERYEFLGDRVLGLSIAHWIFERFPQEPEGALAKRLAYLTHKATLASVASDLGLERVLIQDFESCAQAAHRETLLSDSLEAILGLMYCEAGMGVCQEVVKRLWLPYVKQHSCPPIDPKSALQEHLQELGHGLPTYQILSIVGQEHDPCFRVSVTFSGSSMAYEGEGSSKKKAEQEAAQQALKDLLSRY